MSAFDSNDVERTHVAIIGSGFAGLAMAIRLKQTGFQDFLVAEQANAVGGTWRDNHYPGCACDVQSNVYSFSFAPNPGWSRRFAPQGEIRRYLEDCAHRYGLHPHLRFGMTLQRAEYDEAAHQWSLRFANGRRVLARVLVSAMGGLSRPSLPALPGLENFQGTSFHSQQWDHDYPLDGKRVAVIGTGASAIQFVPRIAPRVARLDLFQRTAPWIMRKPDSPLSRVERWAFTHLPITQRLSREALYWMLESRVFAFSGQPHLMNLVQRAALGHLRRQVGDPWLRQRLTPDYTIGCKRVLISNDYYPAVCRDNVNLVTEGIARIERDAVVTQDGIRHPADCLIFGTGFQATDPFPRGLLIGRGGQDIVDTWREGAHAYLGTTLPGYPNFFMVVGPNTGLGHHSMVLMIEAQVNYILQALERMAADGFAALDVKPAVEQAYNERLQARLQRAIWSVGGCRSWYLDPRSGKNTTLWPGSTWRFRRLTARFDLRDYALFHAEPGDRPAASPASRPPMAADLPESQPS